MTAVKGPFVFTSDRWSDDFITKAESAGCGALALQVGVAPSTAYDKTRAARLQVIGWGTAQFATLEFLTLRDIEIWMPQAESTEEFDELIDALREGVCPPGVPCEPVMTSGGMETNKPNATDAEKVAERNRRRDLLRSFGVTRVWVEMYKQDADRSGQQSLGDVDAMCGFFVSEYGFAEAHPVLGLWTVDDSQAWAKNPYSVSKYDLSRHGRTFGAWRAEQMDDARYAEIKAVPAVALPPPPDSEPPPTPVTTEQARTIITDIAQGWEGAQKQPGPKPLTRISICKRIAGSEFTKEEWERLAPTIKALLDEGRQ